MNIKEGLTPNSVTHTREKERALARQRSIAGVNLGSDEISSIESGVTGSDDDDNEVRRKRFWSERRGVRRVDIPMNNQYLPLPWLSQASLNNGNTW